MIFQKTPPQKSAARRLAKKFSAQERAQYAAFRKKYTVFFPDETVFSIKMRRASPQNTPPPPPPTECFSKKLPRKNPPRAVWQKNFRCGCALSTPHSGKNTPCFFLMKRFLLLKHAARKRKSRHDFRPRLRDFLKNPPEKIRRAPFSKKICAVSARSVRRIPEKIHRVFS